MTAYTPFLPGYGSTLNHEVKGPNQVRTRLWMVYMLMTCEKVT